MTTFDTAKISSIDRIKGRIGLSMRNGLESVGTYPYDIATLREGMSVLIGKVDNSHVILNQVENVPRVGTSYSVRRPVVVPPPPAETGQLLILNFEGADGATTWTEEAQGLIAHSYNNYFKLDTATAKYGSATLLATGGDALWYWPELSTSGNFTVHGWVCISGIATWTTDYSEAIIFGSNSASKLSLALFVPHGSGNLRLGRTIVDREYNELLGDDVEVPFQESTWHHVAIIVNDRDIMYSIDGTVQGVWTSGIENPMDFVGGFGISFSGNIPITVQCRWDAVELVNYAKWTTNFTPPTHAPVLGVITV